MASSDYCCHCGGMMPVDVIRDVSGTGFYCKVCGSSTDYVFAEDPREQFPVTDDDEDAPDGAIVDGYQRHGNYWQKNT